VSRRGALGDPRFRRLLAGQGLSSFGDSALYLTLGIWAKSLTGSNAAAGGVFLALTVPFLAAPLAGHLADRRRRKPLLVVVNVVTALIVLTLLAVRSRDQLWVIYLVAFCYGISWSILGSAGAGLLKDMLNGDDLASANAMLSSVSQGVRVLSPLVGATIFTAAGGRWVAVLDAVTFGAAVWSLASIRVEESRPEPARRGAFRPGAFLRDAAAGFGHIRSVPLLSQLTLVGAIAFGVIGLEETIIFAVIGQGLHRPPSFFGVATSVQGAGSIAGGLAAAFVMRRAGAGRTAGLALACFTAGALAYRTSSLAVVLAGTVADGLAVVWLSTSLNTAAQRYTPPRLQGRVDAAVSMFLLTPQTASIAAGAALIGIVSYRLMLLVVAVVIGGCAAYLLVRPAAAPSAERHAVVSSRSANQEMSSEALLTDLSGIEGCSRRTRPPISARFFHRALLPAIHINGVNGHINEHSAQRPAA
jgi:hypothetical protein